VTVPETWTRSFPATASSRLVLPDPGGPSRSVILRGLTIPLTSCRTLRRFFCDRHDRPGSRRSSGASATLSSRRALQLPLSIARTAPRLWEAPFQLCLSAHDSARRRPPFQAPVRATSRSITPRSPDLQSIPGTHSTTS
jgi:hypothetical protein